MNSQVLSTIHYEAQERNVCWRGVCMAEGSCFDDFMSTDVASRLHDEEGAHEFETHLRGLATTGFARASLDEILEAELPEERDWAIGEATAETYLGLEHNITWPWNMERDKRTPKASLPGADLIGFEINGDDIRLALGEVKTSSDENTPPNVMNGRSGMAHQIDKIANNLALINQLLKWLLPRCKGTEHEVSFNQATALFLDSGNRAIALFGVLVRDTRPSEMDLKSRGQMLARSLREPTTCQLIAIYLPCPITNLPVLVSGGET